MYQRGFTCLGPLALLVVLACQNCVAANKLRLCVVTGKHSSRRIEKNCPILDEMSDGIQCIIENDRLSCLRRVAEGSSDMTILLPEDLIVATANPEYKVLITNELRFDAHEKRMYEVVALMRNDANIHSLADVRGKRVCHPGYEVKSDWTTLIATYFENVLVEKECDENKTLIENRVAAASKFFEAACMPGPWSLDATLDAKLKSRYKNLCALCNNPNGCYSGDRYEGREGALLCLTDQVGDIAWVRTADLIQHFKNLGISKADYSYLCNDGTTRSIETEEPCIWITKPWPVVVASSRENDAVSLLFSSLYRENVPWYTTLLRLLENHYIKPVNPDNLGTPEDYLQQAPGFMSAMSRASCKPSRTINWCVTTNMEERKCLRLAQASFAYGIMPSIACRRERHRTKCITAVRDRQADLFVVTPDEEITAMRNSLKRMVHVFNNNKSDVTKIAAVVKKNSNINTLQQLKGKKACFDGYQSVGWNVFVSTMRKLSKDEWNLPDVEAVSNFFSESCVLGFRKGSATVTSNLYSLCGEAGHYGNVTEVLACLTSGGGDVAFVDVNAINLTIGYQNMQAWTESLKNSELVPLCFNDTTPDSCYLAWVTLGSVMVHQNISEVRYEEIYSVLLQMDELFGQNFKDQTPAFMMYGSYDGNRRVIFPEQTQRLQADISHVRFGVSYADIVEDIVKNPLHSDANRLNYMCLQLVILCVASTTTNWLFTFRVN